MSSTRWYIGSSPSGAFFLPLRLSAWSRHGSCQPKRVKLQQQQNSISSTGIGKRNRRKNNLSYVESSQSPEKSPRTPEERTWCEIKEIIAERGNKYRIVWAGEDPETGQPWEPEWKRKSEVTEDAVREWRWKKQAKKRKHKADSGDTIGKVPKRERGQPRKDSLQSPTQSSEYAPTQELSVFKSQALLTDEIEDSFGAPSEFSFVFGERSIEVLVVVEKSQRFNRGQYTIYTNSDIEQDQFVVDEAQSQRAILGENTGDELSQQLPQGSSDKLLSQEVIIESLEKELSSQRSSSRLILVYERAAVIPDSQSLPSSPLTQGRQPRLFSSQEHRFPEAQTGVESQELERAPEPEGELLEGLQVGNDRQQSAYIADLPPTDEQSVFQIQEQPDEQLGVPGKNTIDRTSAKSREVSVVGAANIPPLYQDPTSGIEPQILATEHIYKSATASDRSNTTSPTREKSPRASSLSTGTSTREHSENPPIEAFWSWFTNQRKRATKARPIAVRATTLKTEQSRGRSNSVPVSLPTTISPDEGYSRRSLPPSMKAMSNSNTATPPQAVSSVVALRERLARSREERNAKLAATRNARNTLSMSPHPMPSLKPLSRGLSTLPAEHVTMNLVAVTPSRLEVEKVLQQHSVLTVPQGLPQAIPSVTQSEEMPQSQMSISSMGATQTSFGPPHLGLAEYVIGLPLRNKSVTSGGINQKEAYLGLLAGKHLEIDRFLANPDAADSSLIKIMQEIVDTSGRIATHPDLPFDRVGISAAAGKEAEYHAAMSSKFVFLKGFLGAVKTQFLKIVIVAEEGKLIDILEIFLRGLKISHTRLDRLSTLPRIQDSDLEGMVKVFLLPSCKSGAVTNAADCLIAMDSTFDAKLPEIKGFRSSIVEVEKLAPVIRFVVLNTIEHMRLCRVPGQEISLHVYIETLKNLRLQVGIGSKRYGSAISRAPTKISEWLQNKAKGALDIPNIPELPLYEPETQLSSTIMEGNDKRKRQEDSSGTQITDLSVSLPLETKRLRVHDLEPSSSLSVFSQQGDITHISNSMPSQPLPPTLVELSKKPEPGPEPELASSPMDLGSEVEKDDDKGNDHEMFVRPSPVLGEVDIESMSKEDLVSALRKKMGELRQWMESTGRLQVRHEELRGEFLETKKQLEKSQKTQKEAETRKERMTNELAKIKAERSQLQEDLKQARDRLLAGPPETAQLEQLRAENRGLNEKLHAAENNVQAKEREFDFLRDQYQQASNGAFELKSDNDSLRKEILVLEKRSGEVVVRLRELQLGNQILERDKRIENLSLQLKEREERIARLEHERAVTTRSRGSLGIRTSIVSIRGSPNQSRATSPTTGVGFHGREPPTYPLRNG